MNDLFRRDAKDLSKSLRSLKRDWDGKSAILELREADFQWRQMEWIGFYFEFLALPSARKVGFSVPGPKYGSTVFDASKRINWDFKAHAIKSHTHVVIANDVDATNASIKANGVHGLAVALLDVKYNDENRNFQRWHTELKGGKSKYEIEREARTVVSRYRKREARLEEIVFIELSAPDAQCSVHRQGRNSNGMPRPPKYQLDLESITTDAAVILRFDFVG